MIAGGLLMVVLWPIFTSLHGPTSFNEDGRLLGQDPLVWGCLMSAPASLLIALGFYGSSPLLARFGRKARVGYVLVLIGLVIPALVDLAIRALGPPLLVPLVAIGLILVARGNRENPSLPTVARHALLAIGVLLSLAIVVALAVPMDISDQMYGYRVFGVLANLLFGAGWIVVGASLSAEARRVRAKEGP